MGLPASIRRQESLRYIAVPTAELSGSQVAAWTSLVEKDNQFRSPFFSPEYSRLVARCVPNVMTGLMVQNGQIVGVFPYEEADPGRARPVGSVFCDYQGAVVRPDIVWTAQALMDGLALESWRFDHVLAAQPQWSSFHQIHDVSWSIDLSSGFEAYETQLRQAKRGQLAEVRRKRRMLEREVGPLSFTPHLVDQGLLDELLAWKSAQWALSGWTGRYTGAWERRLMSGLMATTEENFAGLFSVLRAGDRPVAMHIGMRSRHVWHYWTTAYEPSLARYSPGIVMLVEMLRHAPLMGLTEVDLGKEDFEYKRRLHTHVIPVAEGKARRVGATEKIG